MQQQKEDDFILIKDPSGVHHDPNSDFLLVDPPSGVNNTGLQRKVKGMASSPERVCQVVKGFSKTSKEMDNIVSPSNTTNVLNREGGSSNTVSKGTGEDSKQFETRQSPERRAIENKGDFISNNIQNDF